jgi:molecular chaperone DnaK
MLVSKGIGIDLGTTNSAVAMMDLADSEVILYTDKQGRSIIPSCVWFDPKQAQVVVGFPAFMRRGSRDRPITSIKRRMGTQTTVAFGGQQLRPETVSAYILSELRDRIAETLAERSIDTVKYLVERGIVTVPAYFDLPQIEATREAGRLANLDVIELLHEPVAAAVYYSWKHNIADGTFLVYDLGGGTFDVSVLRRTAGEFEVLGISGDNFLGGDDFDRLLARWIRDCLVEDDYQLELDLENNPDDALRFAGLVALAEQAKKSLTDATKYQLRDQNTLRDQNDERVIIDLTITRETFEELIYTHIQRTIPLCWTALAKAHQKAGITLKDIDYVCLVGGSTYVPLVQQVVAASFCSIPNMPALIPPRIDDIINQIAPEQRDIARQLIERQERARCTRPAFDEPDTCVALGAAIRAASAGLSLYDDQRKVQVRLRGQGGTTKGVYSIRGHVESLIPDVTLVGGRIEIGLSGRDARQQQELADKGQFYFKDVPLQGNAINAFSLGIYDSLGRLVAELGHTVAQSTDHRDIGGVLSTAVLSKPILLEGKDKNRLTRGVLLPEGTSLPATAEFRFELSDSTGRVRFPLYQASRKIKEVAVQIDPGLPKGTPVYFTIHCDEQVNLKIEGEIGDRHFDVPIGPPPLPEPPSQQDLLVLEQQFVQKVHGLPAEEAEPLKQMFGAIMSDIQEALRAADDAKAISKVADIEGLVKSIDLRTPDLEPPWETFQRMIVEGDQLIQVAADTLTGFDAQVAKNTLDTIVERARQAQAASDQQEYTETIEAFQALGGSIQRQLAEASGARQELPPEIMAAAQVQEITQKGAALQFFCLIQARSDLAKKIVKLLSDVESRRAQVRNKPQEVIRWCVTVDTELGKIFQELRPEATVEDMTKELVSFSGAQKHSSTQSLSSKDIFRK